MSTQTAPVSPLEPSLGVLSRQEDMVIRLMRRKPALGDVFTQIGEMLLFRRNCRVQVETVDGIVRRYDVTPATGKRGDGQLLQK